MAARVAGPSALGTPSIRLAETADVPPLAALIAAFRDHLGASRPTDEEIRALLPGLLAHPDLEYGLVVPEEGEAKPLGYVQTVLRPSLWARGAEVHVEDLFVAAPARGRGLGAALLDFVAARARARGARVLRLASNERNEGALRFYARAGFAPESEAIWHGGREILLVRRLEP